MVSKSKAKKEQLRQKASGTPEKRKFEVLQPVELDDEELMLTIETLESLTNEPAMLRHKTIKPLKTAIHNFMRAAAAATSSGSLTNRISDALTDARWVDARVLLAEFRIRGEDVRLGTLQRWVREVDAAAASGTDVGVSADVFLTLDAILRATSVKKDGSANGTAGGARSSQKRSIEAKTSDGLYEADSSGVITFDPPVSFNQSSGLQLYQDVLSGAIFEDRSAQSWRQNAKIVEITPAAARKPPNQYDARIYTTIDPLIGEVPPETTSRHDIPAVPGAFIIEGLLTSEECRNIIRQGEAVEFSPDCAVAGSATQQASILAHNFYYYSDDQTLARIYNRALPFLPESIEGCAVKGINARFRVYRYVPGAVYRPHIDGSWPRSGLDSTKPEGSQYIYDDTRDGAQLSRLTFLIYLNDDFEEGYTTFFIPDNQPEKLRGVRVVPRIGSVLVFPHGDSIGALLHEGSSVKSGAKYVIRTDVLYEKSEVKK
ncbi:Putative uncharacterized protein [Taphrina deformans PYCC 5710]|uniref:Fe2OG dioxygenase domain-containing protein n=1 Tax=Taphrina deformans (strain PYCC 5710 / ATCC 11124 / CBS 356.35 / IMI 108563 / JCM 9778 / NBRC 8474) TaxID=1097556 RepID=R4XIS3_TAPDE|nr:Putative uncharacterized protein [Taphrina deformans PYCC 5710]|eukprot:CCG83268.1 Putative uncharacterized protein [Taphrina deformans PYCC 5710]